MRDVACEPRSVARVLADAASTFVSAEEAEDRLRHVLVLLRELVSYDTAELALGTEIPFLPRSMRAGRENADAEAFARLLVQRLVADEHAGAVPTLPDEAGSARLAVPLVSHAAETSGVLCLSRPAHHPFGDEDLQRLSVVGSLVSSYLSWLLTRAAHSRLVEFERAARERAEVASRAKDVFLANLSHELRTPLNAIAGWASLLKRGGLNEATTRRAVDVIDRSATAEALLIDDVLDLSRIASGKLRIEPERLDLRAAVGAVIDTVTPTAEIKRVALHVDIDPSLDIVADAARLRQVLWNLVSNALKFTPGGGVVDVSGRRDGTGVVIEVRDTGIGISSEFLPHLFERFSQEDSSTRRTNTGLGLGLAIVRYLVEAHGGAVEAESAGVGRGTTFRVRLPAPPAAGTAEGTGEPAAGASANGGVLGAARVLVVDDDADAREVLQLMLSREGAAVHAAASGHEATALVRDIAFDVLLLDLGMPGEDGYALLKRLRDAGCTAPACAVTAYGLETDRQRAEASGFECHLTKPVTPDRLVAAVRQILHLP